MESGGMKSKNFHADVEQMLECANSLFFQNRLPEAIDAAQEVIDAIGRDNLDMPDILSDAYCLLGGTIISQFGETISLQNSKKTEQEEKARKAIQMAIRIAPGDYYRCEAFRTLGDLETIKADYVSAISSFNHAVQIAKTPGQHFLIFKGLANAEALEGLYDTAISHCYKALELVDALDYDVESEKVGKLFYILGHSYANIGRGEKSYGYFLKAIKSLNDQTSGEATRILKMAHFALGNHFIERDRFEQAEYHFERTVKLSTDANPCLAIEFMMLAETYIWMDKNRKALKILKKAQELNPGDKDRERIEKDINTCLVNLGRKKQ